MKINIVKIIPILLLLSFSLSAKEKVGLKLNGSMYSELGLIQTWETDEKDEFDFTGKSIFSLGFKNNNRKYGKVEGLFDLILPYGSSILEYSPQLLDSVNSKIIEILSFGKVSLLFDLRKLYISMYLPFADISMGRQIINFGKGIVFSPVDVFSVVELQDLNFRKTGSDIVNIKVPINDLSGIDLIVELPFLNDGFSSAIKFFTTFKSFDIGVLGIYKKAGENSDNEDEILGGITFKGDLGVGIYGETVLHYTTDSKKTFFEGMLGVDYSIKGKWIFALEYLYKQKKWELSNWGEHNLFGSTQFVINELSNISCSFIYNFEEKSAMGTLQYFYNILQNVNTILYVQGIDSDAGTYLKYSVRAEVKF